jgi:hypothetical protein
MKKQRFFTLSYHNLPFFRDFAQSEENSSLKPSKAAFNIGAR